MKIPLPVESETKFQMAPMIDMVFLLLVFFMCASRLSQVQSKELEIPTATRAVVPKERPDRFTINIMADGSIFGGQNPVDDAAGLKAMVKVLKDENPDLKVYLRADKETEHVYVKRVMNVMAELGIDDFIFGAFIPNE